MSDEWDSLPNVKAPSGDAWDAVPDAKPAAPEPQEQSIPSAFVDRIARGALVMKDMYGYTLDVGKSAGKHAVESTAEQLTSINERLNPTSEAYRTGRESGAWTGPGTFIGVGKGLFDIATLPLAPFGGALTETIAKPYSDITGMPIDQAREAAGMALMALRPGAGTPNAPQFSRPILRGGEAGEQLVGGLPHDVDFKTGAELLGGKSTTVPPPAEGTVRFYHGGVEYVDGPRWLTPYQDYAKGYAGEHGKVHYVDIPERWLQENNVNKSFDDTGTDFKAPYVSFEAPEEIAKRLKVLNTESVVESNLRRAWEEDGIHPAEAAHDAQNDSFVKHDLTTEPKPFKLEPAEEEVLTETGGKPGNLSAAAGEPPADVSLAKEPARPPGSLMTSAKNAADTLLDIGRDAQMLVAPMARGTTDSMAMAKDFANTMRRNRWEWSRIDAEIEKSFTPEQRTRMWNAADEESVARQLGEIGTPPPPPAPGTTRIYRGEGGTAHGLAGRPAQTGSATTGGWFSTDLAKAKLYGKVSYVDITRDDFLHFAQGHGGPDELVTTNPVFRNRMRPFNEGMGAAQHQGLTTLEPVERAAVEQLQTRAQYAWVRARDLGMVEGEGLPAYTPRMVMNATLAGGGDGAIPLNGIGLNLRTKTPGMRQRLHMTVEETEAAAKAKYGADAYVARDIRALPLATAQLEDAIAGRTLINNIKDYGKRTGSEMVSEGAIPAETDAKWFTLDHPSFRTWRPKLETVEGKTQAVKDADGNTIFEQVPIYVHGDFEGPLRAVLTQRSGPLYGAMMALKGKTMSLIMNSPMIHNAVEWGRAVPAMPGKVATFKVYFEGNRVKNDVAQMREAIDAGLVPIGKRFFNQDITSIMESPDLTPGRSWTAKILGAVPGLFDENAGVAVKRAIDKAGDFWHNTLLWDRIADLQAGLYANFRDDMIAKGIDRQTSARVAAHWANRYAGALPQEAMSDAARKVANTLLFSRSFTLGNLGVMKDMLTGLPKDVIAQIERDGGFGRGSIATADSESPGAKAVSYAKMLARRKAMSVVLADIVLFYVGNSMLQSMINVVRTDRTVDTELKGYSDRLAAAMDNVKEHPLALLQPFDFLERLSSTNENEPGKKDRIRVGTAKDGTAIYMRNPVGKIGEEFIGYMNGPLDMMRRKLGTVARPAWQILSNDKGFGRKVYDPDADTPAKYLANLGRIAAHLAASQVPEGQMNAAMDLVKGEGDKNVNTAQALGPFAGVTFAKGAPGGPAVGELYHAKTQHQFAIDQQLPDIRKQIVRGDLTGAQERMTALGIPPGLQKFYIRTSQNPETRLSGRTLRDFYLYATPEQKERFERARQ